jgi:L-threonylcarbamoyladenylate synthase
LGIGCDATNAGGQDLQTETKSRNPKHDRLDEWRKMMYNVFKDIPEVAWQIIDLSENPTTLILDNPRNVAQISYQHLLEFGLSRNLFFINGK